MSETRHYLDAVGLVILLVCFVISGVWVFFNWLFKNWKK